MTFKDYLGNTLKGKKIHLKCNCLSKLDVEGVVVDYYVLSGELILRLQRSDGKIYDVGENHPGLEVI